MYIHQPLRFISKLVKQVLTTTIKKTFPLINGQVLLQNQTRLDYDYVSPSAIKYFNMNKNKKQGTTFGYKSVSEFAQAIANSLQPNPVIASIKSNEQGFLQIKIVDNLIQNQVNKILEDLSWPKTEKQQRVLIDFSSPNIAKQMHVGHLRSTIIGESICRILEFMGHQVHRINHLGDWGTQFGMLIAYMQFVKQAQLLNSTDKNQIPDISDLDGYYKAARKKFDSDPVFKKKSQQTVVALQAYDQATYNAWKKICEISRIQFNKIYQRLGITLDQFGQSFYNKMIPGVIKELQDLKMVVQDSGKTKKGKKVQKKGGKQKEESQGQEQQIIQQTGAKAKCIFIDKHPMPLIVVKSDGGFNYDSTDMAAIRYRLLDLKGDRLIYITDSGQYPHFELIFLAAKKAGWLTTQRVQHMGFGVITGENGKKFSTRKGQSVKLMDLLNEAKQKALQQLKSREKQAQEKKQESQEIKQQTFTSLKPQEYQDAAEKLGIASIKYFDLKQNRISSYAFDYKKMLDPRGNTAIYLIYAYVRICSIIRKSGYTSQQLAELSKSHKYKISHPDERNLAANLVKFLDILQQTSQQLAINKLTDFIYDICVKVQENYKKYRIVGDKDMETRILLCEAVKKILLKSFFMVGIVPLEKI